MQPVAPYAIDALLRGPAQGIAFSRIGVAPNESGPAEITGGGIAEQRAESLKTVPGNRIAMPFAGNPIAKPKEGIPSMDEAEDSPFNLETLKAKFAKAQEHAR